MPFNFVSPGAAAASSIEELLAQQVAQRRQAMLDEITRRNSDSMIEDRSMNRQIQQANLDTLAAQRTSMEDERNTGIAQKVGGLLSPDQELDPATVDILKRGHMGALVKPGEIGGMLPPEMGEGPTIEPGGSDKFRGSATQLKTREDQQRAQKYLDSLDPQSREAQALRYEISTGKAAPAGMFDKQQTSPDIAEYEYYTAQATKAGQTPISFQEWQKQAANLKQTSGSGGQPYFIPVTTGNGVIPFDARTGKFNDDGRKDLRPSATAEDQLTKSQSTLYQLGELEKQFTPDRVGVLRGRYKTMQLAIGGEMGDQGLADMQSTISTLKNTVINLRTGAQMSEPEAQRILQEVPDFNLPPDVFMARLQHAKNYFADYLSRRAKLAFGRTTSGDVDQMLGGEIAPAPSHTPTAPGAAPTAAPSAAPRSKYKVTVQ